ncbi:hypothetical protein FB451DRAFT_1268948 [Mycena latifolia]|nr:hypothetical protein FB451DRAFT_1268948 [Mycena latifolia]
MFTSLLHIIASSLFFPSYCIVSFSARLPIFPSCIILPMHHLCPRTPSCKRRSCGAHSLSTAIIRQCVASEPRRLI